MLHVRRAGADDLEALVQMRLALFRDLGVDADEAELARELRAFLEARLPGGEFLAWLAEAEGRPVACGGLVFLHKPPDPANLSGLEGYILNMYTLPEWRARGAASAVLRAILAYLRQTPARRARLHATELGRPIYARAGFRPVGSEMVLSW